MYAGIVLIYPYATTKRMTTQRVGLPKKKAWPPQTSDRQLRTISFNPLSSTARGESSAAWDRGTWQLLHRLRITEPLDDKLLHSIGTSETFAGRQARLPPALAAQWAHHGWKAPRISIHSGFKAVLCHIPRDRIEVPGVPGSRLL